MWNLNLCPNFRDNLTPPPQNRTWNSEQLPGLESHISCAGFSIFHPRACQNSPVMCIWFSPFSLARCMVGSVNGLQKGCCFCCELLLWYYKRLFHFCKVVVLQLCFQFLCWTSFIQINTIMVGWLFLSIFFKRNLEKDQSIFKHMDRWFCASRQDTGICLPEERWQTWRGSDTGEVVSHWCGCQCHPGVEWTGAGKNI